jgi:hypothetical protein
MGIIGIIAAIILGIAIIVIVFFVRNNKFAQKYAVFWIVIGGALIVFLLFPGLLVAVCNLLGISLLSNLLFAMLIALLILVCIHHSIVCTKLEQQNLKLAQKITLLEAALETSLEVRSDDE